MVDREELITSRLRTEWTSEPRPLFLVDEVREPSPDPALGEFVSFVVVAMSTQAAVMYADDMEDLRKHLSPADAAALIKGAKLYGAHARRAHDAIRARVSRAVAESYPGVARFTTSSRALKRFADPTSAAFVQFARTARRCL
jgi:hypothetical protein